MKPVRTWLLLAVVLLVGVAPGTAFAAGCDGTNIIFSEIDYDQPGTDTAEFIELRIINATTISQCELRFINGATPSAPFQYGVVDLSGTYPSNKYLVIGSINIAARDLTMNGNSGTCTLTQGQDCIQNGNNDGFALVDTSGAGTLVWFVSYEGQITNYNPGDGTSNSSVNLPVSETNSSPNVSINNGPVLGITDAYTSTTVTIGNPGPNAVTLQTLTATPATTPLAAALPIAGLLIAAGLALIRRRRA